MIEAVAVLCSHDELLEYERIGSGPAVVLVGGAFVDRSENVPLAAELAESFTVYNYDRRGRGDSGDTLPYAVVREIEDIQALIDVAGGLAHLYGISSGGVLALEAAAAGTAIDKLAVYEVPYDMADDAPQRQREYVEQLEALLAEGRRGDAAELFMRACGLVRGDDRGGQEFADVAGSNGYCAHARL
jgi:pimeloyl-ACP methyl ester carboxylesterase